jgi:sigma-B regulation protein RsbU (phosphoserine phosphatase)
MASTAAHIRSFSQAQSSMSEAMVHTNSLLLNETPADTFVTLLMIQISSDSRTLTYVSAGHPTGYVLNSTGELKASLVSTEMPLAIDFEADFPVGCAVGLRPGDIILLFSDGVIEAMSSDGALFGQERALGVVRNNLHKTAREIVESLLSGVGAFCGSEKHEDDLTAVVVKVSSFR